MASTTNEDEIIKKRLLIEGDSGNEDRCINKLIKLLEISIIKGFLTFILLSLLILFLLKSYISIKFF